MRIAVDSYYETKFGLHDHRRKITNRPLVGVAYHPGEDVISDSLLEEAIRTYDVNKIGEVFKLSLTEFLDLPIDVIDIMVALVARKASKKSDDLSDLEKSIGKLS